MKPFELKPLKIRSWIGMDKFDVDAKKKTEVERSVDDSDKDSSQVKAFPNMIFKIRGN